MTDASTSSNEQVREALQAALAYLPESHWEGDHYGGYTVPAGEALLAARSKVLAALESLPVETSSVITPLEQLLVEWWSADMENAELFNRAVRLSPALAAAMNALPEKSE